VAGTAVVGGCVGGVVDRVVDGGRVVDGAVDDGASVVDGLASELRVARTLVAAHAAALALSSA